MSIRDWLEPMLRDWGAQRRRIISGRLVRRDGTVHEDGWPSISITASAREGGITGGSGHARQHFPEVYTEDALEVWRAFLAAPFEIREVIHLHYVVRFDDDGTEMTLSKKAKVLGVVKTIYFRELRAAEYYLAGKIDVRTPKA